jgi:CPA2 family monovalent cation:H+ antiporter-2
VEFEFLKSLVIIFGVSAIIVFLLGRLKIPSIVGFLIAGVIMGPYGFELIKDVHEIEILAEIGVILLMFTIGLEFSLKNLLTLRTAVFGGGLIQVSLTIVVVALINYFLLQSRINTAIFNGFLVSLSSTAIVIKMLFDRAEMNAPHGRISVGMLIFQDLCVVPFMLFVPLLAGNGVGIGNIALTFVKALMIVGIILFASRWAVPHILQQVVATRSRELFVISIILLCLGTALLTSKLGLSLALGAFLAGIMISESEYASQAIADILPFKESFTGLFFISIGMLLNLHFSRLNFTSVIGAVIAILIIKIVTVVFSSIAIGQSLRNSLQAGFYLFQIGEFSFILAVSGKHYGLITEDVYQIFLSASVLTMMLTPLMISTSFHVSNWFLSRSLLQKVDHKLRGIEEEEYPKKKAGHVIIIGFGVNGGNLARVLRKSEIPYVVLEINSNTVRKMKRKGEPIYYGDGTSVEILHKLGIQRAKVLVIAISDAAATRMIAQIARNENPDLYIIVRTRYVAEVDDLKKLGANEVIPEEFETSVEIFSRVLHHYHIPRNVITEHMEDIRKDNYMVLRTVKLPKKHLAERYELLKELETETYMIKETSKVDGYSINDLRFRTKTGVTVIAIQRKEKVHQNPTPDFVLKTGDVLLMIGKKEDINRAIEYLESGGFVAARRGI